MALSYAFTHLSAASRALASSHGPLAARLQDAWTEHLQMLWEKPCLPSALNEAFRQLWRSYTAPSSNGRATDLRTMGSDELSTAAAELIDLALRVAEAHGRGEEPSRPSPA